MNKTENIFTKYQLPLFFILTYLLSWSSVPFANGGLLPHGPTLAAIIVSAISTGKQGLGDLWRRIALWRVAWYWYAIGPAILLVSQGVAFVINLLLGATVAVLPHIPSLGVLLPLLLFGGVLEEIGWTGYALPKLQERFADRPNGPLIAALILGVFRAIWQNRYSCMEPYTGLTFLFTKSHFNCSSPGFSIEAAAVSRCC